MFPILFLICVSFSHTDIFITIPISLALHEVNGSSLLDFSFYDPEKSNIIEKFCHFVPHLFFPITYEYVDQHRYMSNAMFCVEKHTTNL